MAKCTATYSSTGTARYRAVWNTATYTSVVKALQTTAARRSCTVSVHSSGVLIFCLLMLLPYFWQLPWRPRDSGCRRWEITSIAFNAFFVAHGVPPYYGHRALMLMSTRSFEVQAHAALKYKLRVHRLSKTITYT